MCLGLCVAAGLCCDQVHAELVTDSNNVPLSAKVIGFSQFYSTGRISLNTGDAPIKISNVEGGVGGNKRNLWHISRRSASRTT